MDIRATEHAISAYDFLIVGGGSAGLVLANRLSTDPAHRVLVIEAGRTDHRWDPIIRMPAALALSWGNPRYDWCYTSQPEPHLHGRRLAVPRGKLLGGSSSINGMVYQRGNPADFDRWAAAPGMQDWDFAHCAPYFARLERSLTGRGVTIAPNGSTGPQILERAPARGELNDAFFTAVRQAGHAVVEDVNGPVQEGFSRTQRTIHRGRRYSAADAYLYPLATQRPNLTVLTGAQVLGIDFAGRRATGVRYRGPDGRIQQARATEIVLAGGSINTPQLLQLSGIGDPDHLRTVGVKVRIALPGVGQHLQDHLAVHLQHSCTRPVSLTPKRRIHHLPGIAAQWIVNGTGVGATNHFEAGGFASTSLADGTPDVMILFAPVAMRWADTERHRGHGYQLHLSVMRSRSTGSVTIASSHPLRPPLVQFGYLSDPQDRRRWVEAIGIARDILGRPAFSQLDGGEVVPGPGVHTDDQIVDWVARNAQTGLHPTSTCRMGTTGDAVVDPATMGVHGVDGLRVVDASVFPDVPNGNTYAPVMMVAERAADLVLGNTPLLPVAEHPTHAPDQPAAGSPFAPALKTPAGGERAVGSRALDG